jgi:hypothetical protein
MNTMDLALQPLAQGTAAGSGDVAAKRGRGAAFVRGSKLVVLTVVLGALVLVGCGKSTATSAGSSAGVTSSVPAAGAAGGAGTSASAATTSAGGCPTSNTKSFAKSKFVLHVGLAAGTFHRYLYKPFKAGTFHKGASGRISGLVKGGATALFDEHEIRQAITDVKASPALCKVLIAPLSEVADKFTAMKSKLTSGDTTSLDTVNSSLSSISSTSAKDGAPITERTDQSAG